VDALSPGTQVSELRVIAGSGYDPRHREANLLLHVERDPGSIATVRHLLAAAAPWRPSAWMQEPSLSSVLLDGRRLVDGVGLLGDGWLRTAHSDDLRLADPDALDAWLTSCGVRPHPA